jgi:hypothetical protein
MSTASVDYHDTVLADVLRESAPARDAARINAQWDELKLSPQKREAIMRAAGLITLTLNDDTGDHHLSRLTAITRAVMQNRLVFHRDPIRARWELAGPDSPPPDGSLERFRLIASTVWGHTEEQIVAILEHVGEEHIGIIGLFTRNLQKPENQLIWHPAPIARYAHRETNPATLPKRIP